MLFLPIKSTFARQFESECLQNQIKNWSFMEHYFIEKEHKKDDYFQFDWNFLGQNYKFLSCDDVFSKNTVDYGTYVLLKTIKKCVDLRGNVLDIGCGYGAIGIVLAKNFESAKFMLSDINGTAVELAQNNVKLNATKNIKSTIKSDAYQNIDEMFDFVISNPPIKAGKKVLLGILLGAYDKLNEGGKLIFVIKKKFGADGIKKRLSEVFAKVEVLERDSGYYILQATK